MFLNAYSLYDVKALSYSPPFFAAAHGLATRMVMELASDHSTSVGRHPADFTLYCVGRFDTDTGQVLPASAREHIADVLTLAPRPAAPLFERHGGSDYVPGAAANGRSPEMNFEEPERFPVREAK